MIVEAICKLPQYVDCNIAIFTSTEYAINLSSMSSSYQLSFRFSKDANDTRLSLMDEDQENKVKFDSKVIPTWSSLLLFFW